MKRLLLVTLLPLILTGCAITPKPNDITYIALSRNDATIGIDQEIEIDAIGYIDSTHKSEYQSFNWSFKDESLITYVVSNSSSIRITGVKKGETTLTCVSAKNTSVKAECKIKVTDEYVPQKEKMNYTYDDYIANNVYYPMSNAPLSGDIAMLVIPVWFTDSKNYIKNDTYKAQVRGDIEKAYFGNEEDTGWQSVKTYYESESRGKVHLNGVVSDWYDTKTSVSTYGNENEDNTKTATLVTKAYNWFLDNNKNYTAKDFDKDEDGYVDAIMLIYAYPNSETLSNSYKNLWAYCYWANNAPNKTSPKPNVFFWASYDFMYDSSTARSRTGSAYGYGNTSHLTIDTHTYIHEMGHVFGLEDYYDYSNQYNPAGGFSMQDHNVGSHDPYSRMAYGWDSPIIPTESCTITINTYENSGDLILLAANPSSFSKSVFDEYLLIELYSPKELNAFDVRYQYSGDPKGPNTTGIRLWHIDARLLDLTGIDIDYTVPTEDLITNTMESGHVYHHAFSNTYYKRGAESNNYITFLGKDYADYNIVQLISNSIISTYKPTDFLSSSLMFRSGSSFDMNTYAKQFKKNGLLNNGDELGWSFVVNSLNNDSATITLTRV